MTRRKKQASLAPPPDARLMNTLASLLFAAFGLMVVLALGGWLARHPVFSLARITVEGEVARTNATMLRTHVAPRLKGNLLTIDLEQTRQAFEEVPWVRQAVVRRQFPNGLRVLLREHQPVAFWGAEGETTLVNSFGEVFEANLGEVEHERLPRLSGPPSHSPQVLAMWQALAPMVRQADLALEQLTLTSRGSWQAVLDSGARIELGRGSSQEVQARVRRFVFTLAQATSRYDRRPQALVAADLRHTDGYAIRLRGVSTTGAPTQQRK